MLVWITQQFWKDKDFGWDENRNRCDDHAMNDDERWEYKKSGKILFEEEWSLFKLKEPFGAVHKWRFLENMVFDSLPATRFL